MSQAFIQVPVGDIDALDKLSKNGLKLYLLLRMSLNRKTRQCNPTPESLGWEKTKYYRARKELELLGLVEFEGKVAQFSANNRIEKLQFLQLGELPISQNGDLENSHREVGETATFGKEYILNTCEPEELEPDISRGREDNLHAAFTASDTEESDTPESAATAERGISERFLLTILHLTDTEDLPWDERASYTTVALWLKERLPDCWRRIGQDTSRLERMFDGALFRTYWFHTLGKKYAIRLKYVQDQYSGFVEYALRETAREVVGAQT